VQELLEFDLLQLLYKLPPESKELQSEETVTNHLLESVQMCQVLGSLFKTQKRELEE